MAELEKRLNTEALTEEPFNMSHRPIFQQTFNYAETMNMKTVGVDATKMTSFHSD